MNMLMTFYVYPLSEKVLLSKTFNAYLDNPRTEEEVEAVREYIERSYNMNPTFNFPPYSDEPILTLESFIGKFSDKFSEEDSYVKTFCASYTRESTYDFIARMWVVVRYDDEGELEALRIDREKLREEDPEGRYIAILDDSSPIVKNSERLDEFSYLMSLLLHTHVEGYGGHSFILDSNTDQFSALSTPNQYVPLHFMMVGHSSVYLHMDTDESRWQFFPIAKPELSRLTTLLDSAFDSGLEEKLSYVAGLLKVIGNDIRDTKTQLVMLVGILELLLTHNPDFNRFNVEDSISKQFRLKTAIILYSHDKSRDLNEIKKSLKTIYELRSKIAHGDFKAVQKYIKAHTPDDELEVDPDSIPSLVGRLYEYVRIVLLAYIEDAKFVDFLKEN